MNMRQASVPEEKWRLEMKCQNANPYERIYDLDIRFPKKVASDPDSKVIKHQIRPMYAVYYEAQREEYLVRKGPFVGTTLPNNCILAGMFWNLSNAQMFCSLLKAKVSTDEVIAMCVAKEL